MQSYVGMTPFGVSNDNVQRESFFAAATHKVQDTLDAVKVESGNPLRECR